MSTDENINFAGAPMPVLDKGAKQYTSNVGSVVGDLMAFSSDIENLEVALKWIDYQFTEQGTALMNYGIEGESYYVEDNGSRKYHYMDTILNDPDYSPSDALYFYIPKIYCGRYCWSYEEPFYAENIRAIQDVWSADDDSKNIASEATMTEEEGNVYNSTYTDIKTLVDEFSVNYILGLEKDTQENFNAFVESLYQCGLQDCIDAKQGAHTRYMNR